MTPASTNGWTGAHYSLFRALFGLYLAIHFFHLLPWSTELFSSAGVLADGSLSPLLLPINPLAHCDAPWFVQGLIGSAGLASLAFAVGFRDRPAAVWIWLVLASILGRNPLILNPGMPYVGWLLLAHCALPPRPFGSLDGRRDGVTGVNGDWHMPRGLYGLAWILLALGYSYSGLTKLASPSWADGSALARVFANPLARDHVLNDLLRSLPDWTLRGMTYGVLGLEILFAPLALFKTLRPWLWSLLVAMHLGIMVSVDFADLTIGMLFIHAFTFDPDWLGRPQLIRLELGRDHPRREPLEALFRSEGEGDLVIVDGEDARVHPELGEPVDGKEAEAMLWRSLGGLWRWLGNLTGPRRRGRHSSAATGLA